MARTGSKKKRAAAIDAILTDRYPGSAQTLCALDHSNPFQLLAATILSAQCTDKRVNLVTPALFARYPTSRLMADADLEDVEALIRSTGFFRAKARSLVAMASGVEERFGGNVPQQMEDLVTLAGVGRKTANVVRSVAFDLPGFPVDTHVGRISRRLELTVEEDPVKVERDLDALFPPDSWGAVSIRFILHGRETCVARKPRCGTCAIRGLCPYPGPCPGNVN